MIRFLLLFAFLLPLGASALPAYLPEPFPAQRVKVLKPAEIALSVHGTELRPDSFREERLLNGTWKFSRPVNSDQPFPEDVDMAAGFFRPDFVDSGWDEIPVPMAWHQIYPKILNSQRPFVKGWYRKQFELSAEDLRERRVILKFDCVGYECRLFLNGIELDTHHGDFTPFEVDVTKAARPGVNTFALRVFSDFGNYGGPKKLAHTYGSGWWIGGVKPGIWQDVKLSLEPEIRIAKLLVTPDLKNESILIDYSIISHASRQERLRLGAWVSGAMPEEANRLIGQSEKEIMLKTGVNSGSVTIRLDSPIPWSPDRPHLYFATIGIQADNRFVTATSRRFGYREFQIVNGRFHLNGKPFMLFGENLVSRRYGGLRDSVKNDEQILTKILCDFRASGYNMLRTAHMPILPIANEIADEVGIMLYHEWGWCFAANIDEPEFEKRNLKELTEFVESVYNHPSAAMWSLGNEVVYRSIEVTRQLNKQVLLVRELDKQKRPVGIFSGSASITGYGPSPIPLETDFYDLHPYTGLSNPWTEIERDLDKFRREVTDSIGKKPGPAPPLVAWECVGFSWGFEDRKDPTFQKGNVDDYLKYAQGKTDWAHPNGIGFSGSMSLADALDPAVSAKVPMSLYGRRIFERFRLDPHWQGFAPWYQEPNIPGARIWNQKVLPTLSNAAQLRPTNLFRGESSEWILEIVQDSNEEYSSPELSCDWMQPDGTTVSGSDWPIGNLAAHARFRQTVALKVPAELATGHGQLRLTLRQDGQEVGRNYYEVYVREPELRRQQIPQVRPLFLYDTGVQVNLDALSARLSAHGITYRIIRNFAEAVPGSVVAIPPEISEQCLRLDGNAAAERFLRDGGILFVLEQRNPQSRLPGNLAVTFNATTFSDLVIPDHPIFAGLDSRNFDTWNNPNRGYIVNHSYMPFTVNALAAKGVGLSRRNIGMSVLEAKVGKGRLICSQLEAFISFQAGDSSAAAYLFNLFAYVAGQLTLRPETREIVGAEGAAYAPNVEFLTPIDLAPYANRSFSDEIDNDGLGGWTDQGTNDFRIIPLGSQEAAGVKFQIIDPAKNNDKSCLVVSGTQRRKFPTAIRGIKVNKHFSRIWFLHTAAWGKNREAGRYRLHYSDGKWTDMILEGGRNIGDWWDIMNLPEARIGIVRQQLGAGEHDIGAFVAEWENPRPETMISHIDFLSPLYRSGREIDYLPSESAVPVLIAATGELLSPHRFALTGNSYDSCFGSGEGGVKGNIRRTIAAGKPVWDVSYKSAKDGQYPAAVLRFHTANLSGTHSALALRIKSPESRSIQILLPDKEWKRFWFCELKLNGDNQFHTYRLRFGKELVSGSGAIPANQLRGELFLFYRSYREPDRPRDAFQFTLSDAVLE